MIGDITGYCMIKKDAKTVVAENVKAFLGDTCRVMEFSKPDGGALIMNRQGTELAMVEKEDIISSFECCQQNDILMPIELKDDFLGQMSYVNKVMTRKGGYNNLLKQMVIASSLHRGTFNDYILWAKQPEEQKEQYEMQDALINMVKNSHYGK